MAVLSESKYSPLAGKRVVVCEDEAITQMHLALVLEQHGLWLVDTASTGKQAIEAVLKHTPDIVLMDIYMPEMDGLQAAETILQKYPVCVIMLTAFSSQEYIERAQRIGASGYIVKPIDSDTVVNKIEEGYRRFCYYGN